MEAQEKRFPYNEQTVQRDWGPWKCVEVGCPRCGEPRLIGRAQYLERFRKGPKCDICAEPMIPIFVCRKCKAHLNATIDGKELIIRVVSLGKKAKNKSNPT